MKSGAAKRRHRVGARERVDAAAVRVSGIRPKRFRDQHAAANAVEQSRVQMHYAPPIAELDLVTINNAERIRVVGMNHHLRASFPRARSPRFGEARIEKATGRRCGEPERMLGIGFLNELPMGPETGKRRRRMLSGPAQKW